MSNFTSKFASRKIGPKFSEVVNQNVGAQQFKPYLYEDQINFATSVFGSGPAFIAYIVNTFLKASKKLAKPYHMNEKDVIGLFKNVLETNYSSKMLDNFVSSISSKKGTTQAGVNYIKSQNIEKIIYTTFQRAYLRSKEIDSEKKNTKS